MRTMSKLVCCALIALTFASAEAQDFMALENMQSLNQELLIAETAMRCRN